MKRLHILFSITILLSLYSFSSFSQSAPLPNKIAFNDASDYKKYEKDFVACFNWLEGQPLNTTRSDIKSVDAFLLQWMVGTPDVSISVNGYATDMAKKNPDMLIYYMGGWSRYVIEHPEEKDSIKFHLEAVEEVLKIYKGMNGVKKDKKIDKLVLLQTEGKLEEYIKSQIK